MSTADLVEQLRQGTRHLDNMADGLDIPWDPTPRDDPRQVHNMYVKNLVASYVSRFSEVSNGVLDALERGDFLVYALCGRALIETTAMLRYYVMRKYKPLMDSKVLDGHGMKKLVDIDDQHLRGTGFDWESFMFQRYSRLSDAAQRRRGHKGSARRTERGALPKQVPIGRCIDSWSKETSSVASHTIYSATWCTQTPGAHSWSPQLDPADCISPRRRANVWARRSWTGAYCCFSP